MTCQIDLSQSLEAFTKNWLGFVALIVIFFIIKLLASPRFKGRVGEKAVAKALAKLDRRTYTAFHDLYLPHPDGQDTTQLDHVVVSPFGIFVLETKNYRGWIFGSEKQAQWTQRIYKHKARFQNPLHQNHLHVRALMGFLDLPESAFQSVIFFIGDCQFKTPMPPNVLNHGLLQWIENHRSPIINPDQVTRIRESLANHERSTDRKAAARQHLRNLKKRH